MRQETFSLQTVSPSLFCLLTLVPNWFLLSDLLKNLASRPQEDGYFEVLACHLGLLTPQLSLFLASTPHFGCARLDSVTEFHYECLHQHCSLITRMAHEKLVRIFFICSLFFPGPHACVHYGSVISKCKRLYSSFIKCVLKNIMAWHCNSAK